MVRMCKNVFDCGQFSLFVVADSRVIDTGKQDRLNCDTLDLRRQKCKYVHNTFVLKYAFSK